MKPAGIDHMTLSISNPQGLGISLWSSQWLVIYFLTKLTGISWMYVNGLVQDCNNMNNSIANALESLQSYTKPSLWFFPYQTYIFQAFFFHWPIPVDRTIFDGVLNWMQWESWSDASSCVVPWLIAVSWSVKCQPCNVCSVDLFTAGKVHFQERSSLWGCIRKWPHHGIS